jgi:hypothetical protein
MAGPQEKPAFRGTLEPYSKFGSEQLPAAGGGRVVDKMMDDLDHVLEDCLRGDTSPGR